MGQLPENRFPGQVREIEAECDRKPLRWIKVQLPLLKQRARTKILNCHPDLAFSFPNRFAIPTGPLKSPIATIAVPGMPFLMVSNIAASLSRKKRFPSHINAVKLQN